jgi:transcriptional regulator with GAF, ATPase, and Fis domain
MFTEVCLPRWIERRVILAALERSQGKIYGDDGAAKILGMKPTTLVSRIKALKLN